MPELKIGVAFFLNEGGLSTYPIQMALKSVVEKAVGPPIPTETGSAFPRLDEKDERIEGITGFYRGPTGDFEIRCEDNNPSLRFEGKAYLLPLYLDGECVAAKLGATKASFIFRFPGLPDGQPGCLVLTHTIKGDAEYYDFVKPVASRDTAGPAKEEWKDYMGTYEAAELGGVGERSTHVIGLENGYLTVNGMRCREYKPGLFFTVDGEAVDLRNKRPIYGNIPLGKAS